MRIRSFIRVLKKTVEEYDDDTYKTYRLYINGLLHGDTFQYCNDLPWEKRPYHMNAVDGDEICYSTEGN